MPRKLSTLLSLKEKIEKILYFKFSVLPYRRQRIQHHGQRPRRGLPERFPLAALRLQGSDVTGQPTERARGTVHQTRPGETMNEYYMA